MSESEELMLVVDDESIHFREATYVVTHRNTLSGIRNRIRNAEVALREHRIVDAWQAVSNVSTSLRFLDIDERRAVPFVQEPDDD